MDVLTHGLASYSVTRAAFPRASRATLLAATLAGAAADLDQLSVYGGTSAFLTWHRTATHSIVGVLLTVGVFLAVASLIQQNNPNTDGIGTVFVALLAACSLHTAMDLTQNQSVELLWPFRAQRYSADWVAHFDLWILLILLAGSLLPQLLALVTEEIGAKSNAPRGRIGAMLALVGVFIYIGARFVLHGNAVAMIDARTYRGELPHRVEAFAESESPFRWRGIVETERAFHDLELDLARASSFNPDAAVVYYKPEASAPLDAARTSESVRRFLETAKFPKATVEKTDTGYRVELRDLAERQEARSGLRVTAIVETDTNAKVLSDELAWDQKM
jgi:inner membrane protein